MKEKKYITPDIEVIPFAAKDIITTSDTIVSSSEWTVSDTPFVSLEGDLFH